MSLHLEQIVVHGYKQFFCEIKGHELRKDDKIRFINENIPYANVKCKRCGMPLRLSYTKDKKKIIIKEISP
jgi:RNase P subunit RPR2